jgi:cbb3-type cytochrome oxidase maturation protein
MDIIAFLIPAAVALGAMGLGAFLWTLRADQYEDLEGAAHRILLDDEDLPPPRA